MEGIAISGVTRVLKPEDKEDAAAARDTTKKKKKKSGTKGEKYISSVSFYTLIAHS